MSNTRFELYRRSCMELAKTMVIKHHAIAVAVNHGLLLTNAIDDSAQPLEQWKYYLNLAGKRHSVDPVITIRAIESGFIQDIEFNRYTLQDRETTRKEYTYGSRFYNDLKRKYPDEEMRILGVLYPLVEGLDTDIGIAASVEKAISAYDGEIIGYRTDLIEENETDLIFRVQEWINFFFRRWYVPEYSLTDDLYLPTILGMLYVNLPLVIMNIRLDNCKTERAHSFHVREYLDSFGQLGRYVGILNTRQALWLYRNIRYIHRNAGKKSTFKLLVDNILTAREIPIASYNLRHDISQQPTDIYPTIEMFRTAINFRQVGVGSDAVSPEYILEKEVALSRNLSLNVEDSLAESIQVGKHSLSNTVPTKVLESSVLDITDSVAYPLSDVLMNNWIYRSSLNLYSAPIYITHPGTGDRILMSTKDAFLLYLYCYTYAEHLDTDGDPVVLTTIPAIGVSNIYREVPPTLQELRNVVDLSRVSDSQLQRVLDNPISTSTDYLSTEGFYDGMVAVQARMMSNRDLYVAEEDLYVRGYMEMAVGMLYKDVTVQFVPPETTYVDWLADKGIVLDSLSKEDYRAIYVEILEAAAGSGNRVSRNLKTLQTSMLDIMRQLSSYTIQFLQSINSGAEYVEDAPMIRVGDVLSTLDDMTDVAVPTAWIFNQRGYVNEAFTIDIRGEPINDAPLRSLRHSFNIPTDLEWSFNGEWTETVNIIIPNVRVFWDDAPTIDLSTLQIATYPEYTPH